jgi:signal transduction histidine kinase
VEHTRASGLAVDLEVDEPLPVLTPGLDLTAYRILQEALTNALRHSGARRSTVIVHRVGDHLVLSVGDDGVGLGQGSEAGGLGLVGVRERVALYGGTLDVAAGPAGGVMLTASLPLERDE